jgi:hypothetical protein
MEKLKADARKGVDGRSAGRGSGLSLPKAATPGAHSSEVRSQLTATPVRTAPSKGIQLTQKWTDDLPEPPMLISEFPEDASVYDCWYSVDSSQWCPFSLELAQ